MEAKRRSIFQSSHYFSKLSVAFFALVFASIGGYFLLFSHAASLVGDINGDGTVNVSDLSLLLSSYGSPNSACLTASQYTCDLNGAGGVTIIDFSLLLSHYGQSIAVAMVSAVPNLPSSLNTDPVGGWKLEYGDAFGATLGTSAGQDNTLFPNRNVGSCSDTPGFNADEMEIFNCTGVSVDSSGLHLSCRYTPNVSATANYTCGTVNGAGTASGYKFFGWKPGEGQEWAVQTVAQFPPNTGEADPGWWAHGGTYQEELDFFEGFGTEAGPGGTWTTSHPPSNGYIGTGIPAWIYNEGTASQGQFYGDLFLYRDVGFDPSADFHTYTTVYFPDGSLSEYIDGKIQKWSYVPISTANCTTGSTNCTIMGPAAVNNHQTLQLILSYGLRNEADGNPDPYFESGTRNFNIRSISVYENASANDANTVNSGIAPGTTVQ